MRMIQPVVPAGERAVLLEEFTGKGCTNCPKGSREIENLLSIYGEQLVVVSIHANFFANPQFFPIGQYDFRTEEGEHIFDLLGPNSGYPAGAIDQRNYSNVYQQNLNVWAGLIQQESKMDPQVEFSIDRTYDPSSRHLQLLVSGRAKVAITKNLRISVMLTESGIVDAQDDAEAGGIVPDYVHNHVLRGMLTPYDGQDLAESLAEAQEFEADFAGDIPDSWVDNNCDVIVFISLHDGGDISVLQAGEVHLTD